jgi:pimeloyl-ACP methyl ester carboxylesterase
MKLSALTVLLAALALNAVADAAVPPDIAAANRAIGKANDQPGTAKIYAPLAERPPYAAVKVTRDLSYGPRPQNKLDVFQPAQAGPPRAVVIYASGGTSTRASGGGKEPADGLFYDNVMVWAARHNMVGINTDRTPWRDAPWYAGANDIAAMVRWAKANAARYGGDPTRIFLFGHAYGGTDVTTYLAHPDMWSGAEPGVAGAILISAPFNLAPLMGPPGNRAGNPMFEAAHSNLEGMKALNLALYLGSAEFDEDGTKASADLLRDELCRRNCPTYDLFKDHQHISVVYSFNTPDDSVSGPVLRWIRDIAGRPQTPRERQQPNGE